MWTEFYFSVIERYSQQKRRKNHFWCHHRSNYLVQRFKQWSWTVSKPIRIIVSKSYYGNMAPLFSHNKDLISNFSTLCNPNQLTINFSWRLSLFINLSKYLPYGLSPSNQISHSILSKKSPNFLSKTMPIETPILSSKEVDCLWISEGSLPHCTWEESKI